MALKSTAKLLLILLSLIWIAACGDHANKGHAGLFPIVTTGTITSIEDQTIYVRGFKFSLQDANIALGQSAGSISDLQTGMLVTVRADISLADYSGSASSVEYHNLLKGPVADINLEQNTIVVLGQTVSITELTVFQGTSLEELQLGDYVEISGSFTESGIDASYIKLVALADEVVVLTGAISNLDTASMTIDIGDLSINYSGAAIGKLPAGGLQDGLLVEVTGVLDADSNILMASSLAVVPDATISSNGDVIPSLGNDNISLINNTPNTSVLDSPEVQIVLSGFLDHLNVEEGTITVNGLTLFFSTNTLFSSMDDQVQATSIADFFSGNAVKVTAYRDDQGKLVVLSLTLLATGADPDNQLKLTAGIEDLDLIQQIIVTLGLNVQVTPETIIELADGTKANLEQLHVDDFIDLLANLTDGIITALNIQVLSAATNPSSGSTVEETDASNGSEASDSDTDEFNTTEEEDSGSDGESTEEVTSMDDMDKSNTTDEEDSGSDGESMEGITSMDDTDGSSTTDEEDSGSDGESMDKHHQHG